MADDESHPFRHRMKFITTYENKPDTDLARRGVLDKQRNMCKGCRTVLEPQPASKLSRFSVFGLFASRDILFCHYTGGLYCSVCFSGDHVCGIPGRIVKEWDFDLYPICDEAFAYLKNVWASPFIRATDLFPPLFESVAALKVSKLLRSQLFMFHELCGSCPKLLLQEKFPKVATYILQGVDAYSIRDLAQHRECPRNAPPSIGVLENDEHILLLKAIRAAYGDHARRTACAACHAAVFRKCGGCKGPVIMAVDTREVLYCAKCRTAYHIRCTGSHGCGGEQLIDDFEPKRIAAEQNPPRKSPRASPRTVAERLFLGKPSGNGKVHVELEQNSPRTDEEREMVKEMEFRKRLEQATGAERQILEEINRRRAEAVAKRLRHEDAHREVEQKFMETMENEGHQMLSQETESWGDITEQWIALMRQLMVNEINAQQKGERLQIIFAERKGYDDVQRLYQETASLHRDEMDRQRRFKKDDDERGLEDTLNLENTWRDLTHTTSMNLEVVSVLTRWKLPLGRVHGARYLKARFDVRRLNAACRVTVNHFDMSITFTSAVHDMHEQFLKMVGTVTHRSSSAKTESDGAFPVSKLLSLQKSPTNPTKLTLIFAGKNETHDLVFPDIFLRERFWETVSALQQTVRFYCPELTKEGIGSVEESTTIDALGPNSCTLENGMELSGECRVNASKNPTEPMTMWVGNWNAKGAKDVPSDLFAKWLPSDKNVAVVYTFNLQRFLGKHETFFAQAEEYFGKNYVTCATMAQFHMSTIVLVRRKHIHKFAHAEATLGNGSIGTFMRTVNPHGERGSVAVAFKVYETSFCVVNMDLPEGDNSKQRIACAQVSLARMHLGFKGVELTEQFDHVILSAALKTPFDSIRYRSFAAYEPRVQTPEGDIIASGKKCSGGVATQAGQNLLSCLFTIPIVRPHAACFRPHVPPLTISFHYFEAMMEDLEPLFKGVITLNTPIGVTTRTHEMEGLGKVTWFLNDSPITICPPNCHTSFLSTQRISVTISDLSLQSVEGFDGIKASAALALCDVFPSADVDFVSWDELQERTVPLRHCGAQVGSLTMGFTIIRS